MKFADLFNNFIAKNKDYIVKYELIQEGAKSDGRVKKVYAFWINPDGVNSGIANIQYRVVSFWVFDEGEDDESAYFEGGEPKFAPITSKKSFSQLLNEYLAGLKSSGELRGAVVISTDENLQNAVIDGFVEDNGVLVEKKYLVEYDGTKWTKSEISS